MGNRELIQALYDAFAARDRAVMMASLDDQVRWVEAEGFPYAGTHVGPQAVVNNVWRRMGTEWLDWQAKPDMIIVEGDRVAVTGTYSGTYKATGKSFRARFAHVFEMRNGKIIRMEQFVDSAKVNEALT
jgi:Ketosteroid isomerase-related protein